ncbi:WD40-repeat-containing domain protein [Pterulicium gracile]|uniref:Actin-related protein 2/3 complex subunit n=1 Tax=Pterulicium gracile TaxID=1884261 RepID=A0A5C3QY39_9AGAR|nr:WD40-repeat-containing domain protein [Pterula gracilis]
MPASEIYTIAQAPVTCHAFNADRSQVAVSLNSTDVQILTKKGKDWVATDVLKEHDKTITSIDWAPNSNRIVTSSQDRNAYVWQLTDGVWKPTLVLLRINRAATFVRWSPNEDKFAVASGARAIAICSFDPENNWWVSKLLKKPIRSTVLSLDWHPNNVLLAAGSADMKARVFSAYIKEVDERPAPTVWGSKLPFNTICGEYSSPSGGWVHSVGFSPSGDALAFTSHDSSLTIVYPSDSTPTTHSVRLPSLPLVTLAWTTESTIVAAGHDCQPLLFTSSPSSNNSWSLTGSLDSSAPKTAAKASPVGRLNNAAFQTFKNADSRGAGAGGAGGKGEETELATVHQNTITSVRAYSGGVGEVGEVSTTGVDGKLVIWSVDSGSVGGLVGKLGGMRM